LQERRDRSGRAEVQPASADAADASGQARGALHVDQQISLPTQNAGCGGFVQERIRIESADHEERVRIRLREIIDEDSSSRCHGGKRRGQQSSQAAKQAKLAERANQGYAIH
jgi:hypothetical protein